MRRLHDLLRFSRRPGSGPGPSAELDQLVSFRCNICSAACTTRLGCLTREEPTCPDCRSTVRMRAVVRALSLELFGRSLCIDEFPVRKDITGLGLSDWQVYADRLADKLGYTNTYLDHEPRLDIRDLSNARLDPVNFLIATDVFEHVAPPISAAFDNARRLLQPGGVFIFSVPYVNEPGIATREHFPELHDWRIVGDGGKRRLINTTRDGRVQQFDQLVFHGGDGLTLEMRMFSEQDLRQEFARAGFDALHFYGDTELEHGVHWPVRTSLVLSARAAGPPRA